VRVVKTKLCIPKFGAGMVSRPALVARIETGLQKAGAWGLVSAPAGFGKTTLLSEWAATSDMPVVWVSLDIRDNAPVRFWTHVAAAFQMSPQLQDLRVGRALQAVLASASPVSVAPLPPPDLLLVGLLNELADAGVVCALVLDDYHVISSQHIHDGIRFLLENPPANAHLVLAGRADPPWPLARSRAQGRFLELRAADLRFTLDETNAFFRNFFSLSLSHQNLVTLDSRTEGWAAGLQMAGLSLRSQDDPTDFIKSFGGGHRFVLDYLVEEVLGRQPERVRKFLLRTSVLDRLTASLCDAVVGIHDSREMLTSLEEANLFLVPLDGERSWYRYHHLFADLLRHKLAVDPAGDSDLAAELVAECVLPMIEEGDLADLSQLLGSLPDEVIWARPWLCIGYAWTLVNTGELDRAEPLLTRTGVLDTSADSDPQFAGYVGLVRAYVALQQDEFARAAHLAHEALERLPEMGSDLRGYLASIMSVALRWEGRLVEADQASSMALALARQTCDVRILVSLLCDRIALLITRGKLNAASTLCQEAQELADSYMQETGHPLPAKGRALSLASSLALERYDLSSAVRSAREGVAMCIQWGQPDFLASGYCTLARALTAAGDVAGADAAFERAQSASQQLSPAFRAHLSAQLADLKLRAGQVAWAARWADARELSATRGFGFVERSAYMTLARLRIAQGRAREALGLLARLQELAASAGAGFDTVHVLVLQGLAWLALGQPDQALLPFRQALALAEPEGYVNAFVSEGPPVRRLLELADSRYPGSDYIHQLLRLSESVVSVQLQSSQAGLDCGLIEPLTPRELQVLRLLAAGKTNGEIAHALVIAKNTVKNHLKAIYGKLDVHNRTAAVDVARRVDLI